MSIQDLPAGIVTVPTNTNTLVVVPQEALVTTPNNGNILSTNNTESFVAIAETELIVVDNVSSYVVVSSSGIMGLKGDPGPPGISEEDMVYSKRTDFIDDTLLYKGEAAVGSLDTDPVWRIRKITIAALDNDVEERWAGGTALFDKAWSDRLTLIYT
jgi:hypothetical protein